MFDRQPGTKTESAVALCGKRRFGTVVEVGNDFADASLLAFEGQRPYTSMAATWRIIRWNGMGSLCRCRDEEMCKSDATNKEVTQPRLSSKLELEIRRVLVVMSHRIQTAFDLSLLSEDFSPESRETI